MKDNFDLKKFLKENKSFEQFNPFLAESKDKEKSMRDKIREMILAELELDINDTTSAYDPVDENADYADFDEEEDLGDDEYSYFSHFNDLEDTPVGDYEDYYYEEDEELDEAKKDEEETVEDVEVTDTEEFQSDAEMDATPELEADEKEIMTNLETALEFAKQKGDEKLVDQIGNTITFFTRQYIVK
jgi:hypothetical protein